MQFLKEWVSGYLNAWSRSCDFSTKILPVENPLGNRLISSELSWESVHVSYTFQLDTLMQTSWQSDSVVHPFGEVFGFFKIDSDMRFQLTHWEHTTGQAAVLQVIPCAANTRVAHRTCAQSTNVPFCGFPALADTLARNAASHAYSDKVRKSTPLTDTRKLIPIKEIHGLFYPWSCTLHNVISWGSKTVSTTLWTLAVNIGWIEIETLFAFMLLQDFAQSEYWSHEVPLNESLSFLYTFAGGVLNSYCSKPESYTDRTLDRQHCKSWRAMACSDQWHSPGVTIQYLHVSEGTLDFDICIPPLELGGRS